MQPAVMVNHPKSTTLISSRLLTIRQTVKSTLRMTKTGVTRRVESFFNIILVFKEVASTLFSCQMALQRYKLFRLKRKLLSGKYRHEAFCNVSPGGGTSVFSPGY